MDIATAMKIRAEAKVLAKREAAALRLKEAARKEAARRELALWVDAQLDNFDGPNWSDED